MLLGLKPPHDEEAGKQRRHQLAEIGAHGGVGSEESRLSEEFKHRAL
mgnify:CR=1 FL=1